MPNPQKTYWENYKNPYNEPHKPRDQARDVKGKPIGSKGKRGLGPRGHYRMAHLPNIAINFAPVALEARAASRARFPQLNVLERIFMAELLKRHLREGVDFGAQVGIFGGKMVQGGLAPDYILYHPRYCAIEIQGAAWHSGVLDAFRDESKEMAEKALGIPEVFYIEEDTLASDELTQAWFRRNLGL